MPSFLTRFVIIFLLLICLGEVFVRTILTNPIASTPDKELSWVYTPHSLIFHTSEGRAVNKINALGFNEEDIDSNSDKKIVMIFGDSITESLQVNRSENFTSLLEDKAPCLKTYNAGRSGLSPLQYPIIQSRLLQHYTPSLAVMVVSPGDIQDIINSDYDVIKNAQNNQIVAIHLKETTASPLRLKLDPLLKKSALATYLVQRLSAFRLNKKSNKHSKIKNKNSSENSITKTNEKHVTEVLRFVFKKMNTKTPLAILYNAGTDYGLNRIATNSTKSNISEQIFKTAADAENIPFLSNANYKIDGYKKHGQPAVGFPNKHILRGHLNKFGHSATANALFDLLKTTDHQCTAAHLSLKS